MPVGFTPRNPTLLCLTTDLDPATTKRRDYTHGLANANLPNNPDPKWLQLAQALRDLYQKLGDDPAMEPNLDQTFNTPANSKNQVYFMWDFVGRSLHTIYTVPCTLKNMTGVERERWNDVQGRSAMVSMMIADQTSGKMGKLTEGIYPDQKGKHPTFSAEVLEAARKLGQSYGGLEERKTKVAYPSLSMVGE